MSNLASHDCWISQNFLRNHNLAAALLRRSSLNDTDLVVEIGPGRGILTRQLAQNCRRVIAVEKDPTLYKLLRQMFACRSNIRLYQADFLNFRLPDAPYKVFANMPFNICAAIVSRLVSARIPPEDAYLVMQKEASDVLLGLPYETMRTILIKPWFRLEVVHRFRRTDFAPAPGVDVVMLRLQRRVQALVAPGTQAAFRDFVVYGFTTWRPTLEKIFKELFTWPQLKRIRTELAIDLNGTPTSLSLEQWLDLFRCFENEASLQAKGMVWGSEKRLARHQARLKKIHRTRSAARRAADREF